MKARLTDSASRDVDAILSRSRRLFGPLQARRYAEIIETGIAMVVEDPWRPSSKAQADLGDEIRRFHLQFAAGRQGGAARVLYFRPPRDADSEVMILRVLGDEMEPAGRVLYALRHNKP